MRGTLSSEWTGHVAERPSALPGLRELWRLPPDALAVQDTPLLTERAAMLAGVHTIVRTDARALRLRLHLPEEQPVAGAVPPVDVLVDGELVARRAVAPGENVITVDLPGEDAVVEAWLPQFGLMQVAAPEFLEAGHADPVPARPRWIAYGSSITQSREADGPSSTWSSQVARARGWELTNLGFGGQCHLDPVAARVIRDRPAELITLCTGINIYGQASMTERTLRPALVNFVQIVRDGHPRTPILVVSPIASPARERERNAADLTLADVRRIVAETTEAIIAHGDDRLGLIDGTTLLSESEGDLLGDGLHPTSRGGDVIAARLGAALPALD